MSENFWTDKKFFYPQILEKNKEVLAIFYFYSFFDF